MLPAFLEGVVIGTVAATATWLWIRSMEIRAKDKLQLDDDWGTWRITYEDKPNGKEP